MMEVARGGKKMSLRKLSSWSILLLTICLGLPASYVEAAGDATTTGRVVDFFFSAEAWGGTPFSLEEKQAVMARAMLSGEVERLEEEVPYLSGGEGAAGAEVRAFTAVYEVDASERPPSVRAGYELELLVPRTQEVLEIELVNSQTGVVNIVEVAPEGPL